MTDMETKSVRVHLTYPEELIKEPVVARLVRQMDVMVNIRRANIDENVGWMLCELQGEPSTIDAAIEWMRGLGIEVDRLADVVEG